jgi:hypothetical protein
MAKNKNSYFYRIDSTLNAAHGFNFRRDGKLIEIQMPGKYTTKAPNPPPVYITEADYASLTTPEHKGNPSPFSVLLGKGINGGIIAAKVDFQALPVEWQKKFDPEKFEQIEAARREAERKAIEGAA